MVSGLHLMLATAALVLPLAAQPCALTPSEASLKLYKHHRDFVHNGANGQLFNHALSSVVNAAVKYSQDAGEVGPIDYDFWTDVQDGDASPEAEATLRANARGTTYVLLSYWFRLGPSYQPVPKTALVELTQTTSGCWQVEDLHREQRSLRSVLALANTTRRDTR
jgi:hypothetical protein